MIDMYAIQLINVYAIAVHSSFCTILIITGMYCSEGQGAVIKYN